MHINIKYHLVKDLLSDGNIKLEYTQNEQSWQINIHLNTLGKELVTV